MHDLTSHAKPETPSAVPEPSDVENAAAASAAAATHAAEPTAAPSEPADAHDADDDTGPEPGNERPAAELASDYEAEEADGGEGQPRETPGQEKKPPRRNPRLRAVEDAFKNGTPVDGLVKTTNKGGLEVDVAGVRAFCPLSQIELRFCHDPTPYVGQRLRFRVIKFESARNIVLSRKALLSHENASRAEDTRARLTAGTRMRGRVTSLLDYGAFVDLGGITGLVHVSEMAHGRVAHPKEVLRVGQEVEVFVLAVEHPEGRKEAKVSLSLKALSQDPWSRAAELLPGMLVRGTVMRLKTFGAFVELWPGVDGLIHNSNLRDPPPEEASEVVQPGQEVDATVISVDVEKKRIGLSLVGMREPVAAPDMEPRPRPRRDRSDGPRLEAGQIVQGHVEKVEPFGVFVRLGGGARGLIPNAEMGTPPGSDHKKQFPEGTEIKAQVIEVGQKGRIRLSKKAAETAEERAAYSSFMQAQRESASFGTLADLMRRKLDDRKR